MADKFTAKIEAVLDTKNIEQKLAQLETKDLTLKGFKVDSASLKRNLQAAIDATPFTLTVGNIKFKNAAISNLGSSIGSSLSETIMRQLNTGGFESAIAKVNARFQKLGATYTGNESLTAVKGQIESLSRLHGEISGKMATGDIAGAATKYAQFNETLLTVKNTLTTVSSEAKSFATNLQVSTLDNKMAQFLQQNSKYAQQYAQQITNLRTKLSGAIASGEGIETGQLVAIQGEFDDIRASAGNAKVSISGLGQSIASTAKHMAAFASGIMLLRTSVRIFKNMAQEVLNVDTAMTGLRRVTNLTEEGYERMYSKMVSSAKEYGATLTDIIDATTTWVKLGFNANEAQQLGNVTAMYQHVTDLDTTTAVNNLVTAYKGFQNELLQLSGGSSAQAVEYVADIFDKLGNEFALSAADVGAGLVNSASALSVAGNSIQQSAAMITGITEVTQNASRAGNALRTMSMRLRGTTARELEDLGEDTDGLIEVTSKLRDTVMEITADRGRSGIDITDANGQLRSTYDIMRDIAGIWDQLDSNKQANLLETLAGKTRASDVAALLRNWQQVEKAYQASVGAAGTASNEQAKYMESLKGKLDVFKASWQSLANTVIDSDFLKSLVDTGSAFLNVLESIIDKLGTVPTLFSAISAGMSLFKGKGLFDIIAGNLANKLPTRGLSGDIQGLMSSYVKASISSSDLVALSNYNAALKETVPWEVTLQQEMQGASAAARSLAIANNGAKVSLEGLGTTSTAASIGMKALGTAMSMVVALGVSFAITAIVNAIRNYINAEKELHEDVTQAISDYKSQDETLRENKATLDDLASRYTKLSKGVNSLGQNIGLTAAEYEEYKSVSNQIGDILPDLVAGFDDQGNVILKCKNNIDELTDSYNKLLKSNNDDLLAQSGKIWKDFQNQREDFENEGWGTKMTTYSLDALEELLTTPDLDATIEKYFSTFRDSEFINIPQQIGAALSGRGFEQQVGESMGDFFKRVITQNRSDVQAVADATRKELAESIDGISSVAQAHVSQVMLDTYSSMSPAMASFVKQLVQGFDYDFYTQFSSVEDLKNYLNTLMQQFSQLTPKQSEAISFAFDLSTKLNNGECSVSEYLAGVLQLKNALTQAGFDEKTQDTVMLTLGLDDSELDEQYHTIVNKFKGSQRYGKLTISEQSAELDSLQSWLGGTSLGTFQVAYDVMMKPENVDLSVPELQQKVQDQLDAATIVPEDQQISYFEFLQDGTFQKQIDDYISQMEKYHKLQEQYKNSEITPEDLIVELPELAPYAGNLNYGLDRILDNTTSKMQAAFDEKAPQIKPEQIGSYNQLAQSVIAVGEQAGKTSSKIKDLSTAITEAQNAQELLSDAELFNSTRQGDPVAIFQDIIDLAKTSGKEIGDFFKEGENGQAFAFNIEEIRAAYAGLFNDVEGVPDEYITWLKETIKDSQEAASRTEALSTAISGIEQVNNLLTKNQSGELGYLDMLEEVSKMAQQTGEDITNFLIEGADGTFSLNESYVKQWAENLVNNLEGFTQEQLDNIKLQIGADVEIQSNFDAVSGLISDVDKAADLIKKANEEIAESGTNSIDTIQSLMSLVGESYEEYLTEDGSINIPKLIEHYKQQVQESSADNKLKLKMDAELDGEVDASELIENAKDSIDDALDELTYLQDALNKIRSGEGLSGEETFELYIKYPDLANNDLEQGLTVQIESAQESLNGLVDEWAELNGITNVAPIKEAIANIGTESEDTAKKVETLTDALARVSELTDALSKARSGDMGILDVLETAAKLAEESGKNVMQYVKPDGNGGYQLNEKRIAYEREQAVGSLNLGETQTENVKNIIAQEEAYDKLTETMSRVQKASSLIQDANDEIADSGKNSIDTISSLMDMYGDRWTEFVTANADGTSLSINTQAIKEDMLSAIDAIEGATPELKDSLKQSLEVEIETDAFSETVDAYVSNLETLSSALENIKSGDFSASDLYDLISQFPELASSVDDIEGGVTSLIDTMNTDILAQFDEQLANAGTEEARAEIEGLREAIIRLQNEGNDVEIVIDIEAERDGLEAVTNALSEARSETGLSSEALGKLEERYKNLSGYKVSKLFDKTTSGIRLNTKELSRLETAYRKQQTKKIADELDDLVQKYGDLTDRINEAREAGDVQLLTNLTAEQDALGAQINQVSALASEYAGLTSNYNAWKEAQNSPNEGDTYADVTENLETMQELRESGKIGTDDFKKGLQFMTGKDYTWSSSKEMLADYDTVMGKMNRYFTEGSEGSKNFLKDLQKVGEENGETWATLKEDGTWDIDIDNIDDVADKMGISAEAIMAILRNLSDYNFDIKFDAQYSTFDKITEKADSAGKKLQELGKTDYEFNVGSSSVESIEDQIGEAQEVYDTFVNEDGTFNIEAEGAEEALYLLKALLLQKQNLEKPAILQVDVSGASAEIQQGVAAIQQYIEARNQLELENPANGGGGVTQQTINGVVSSVQQLNNLSPEVQASIGLSEQDMATINSTLENIEGKVEAGVEVKPEDLAAITTIINNIDPGTLDITTNASAVQEELNAINTFEIDNKSFSVTLNDNASTKLSSIRAQLAQIKDKEITVTTNYKENGSPSSGGGGGGDVTGNSPATGTAWGRSSGDAFAKGNWGAKKGGKALGGELGRRFCDCIQRCMYQILSNCWEPLRAI